MGAGTLGMVGGTLQALYGIGSSIVNAGKEKRARKDLEGYANSFQPNQSILDYYNKALSKYNPDPTQTGTYKIQQNNIGANTANAIGATQDRRGGLSSISKIMAGANRATGQNVINAENMQGQNLNRLGNAAGMKTNEEQKKFDMLYNLKAMKAGAAASKVNSGIQNAYQGLSTAAYFADQNRHNNTGTTTPQRF